MLSTKLKKQKSKKILKYSTLSFIALSVVGLSLCGKYEFNLFNGSSSATVSNSFYDASAGKRSTPPDWDSFNVPSLKSKWAPRVATKYLDNTRIEYNMIPDNTVIRWRDIKPDKLPNTADALLSWDVISKKASIEDSPNVYQEINPWLKRTFDASQIGKNPYNYKERERLKLVKGSKWLFLVMGRTSMTQTYARFYNIRPKTPDDQSVTVSLAIQYKETINTTDPDRIFGWYGNDLVITANDIEPTDFSDLTIDINKPEEYANATIANQLTFKEEVLEKAKKARNSIPNTAEFVKFENITNEIDTEHPYALGRIIVKVTLDSYYNKDSILVNLESKETINIYVQGFKKYNTDDISSGKVIHCDPAIYSKNLYLSDLTEPENLNTTVNFIASNIKELIGGKLVDATLDTFSPDYILSSSISVNYDTNDLSKGTISFDIAPNRTYLNGLVNHNPMHISFAVDSFYTTGLSTAFPTEIELYGETATANQWRNVANKIKTEYTKKIIQPYPSLPPVLPANVSFLPGETIDERAGTVDFSVSLDPHTCYSNGFINTTSSNQILKVRGFQRVIYATEFKYGDVDVSDYYGNIYADDSITVAQLKDYIVKNPNKFFINPPSSFNGDNLINFRIVNHSITAGTIEISFSLNTYMDKDGNLVDPSDGKPPLGPKTFILRGFDTKGLTTIVTDPFNIKGMDTIPALDVKNDTALQDQLLTKIIEQGAITNVANHDSITKDNLEIIAINDYNNVNGWLKINLKIKDSKYWSDGVTLKEHIVPLTINGFNRSAPTEFANVLKVDGTDTFNSYYATTDVDKTLIKNFIASHSNLFYSNPVEPTDASNIDNIKITNAKIADGEIWVTFELNKYLNRDGHVINGEPFPSPTFRITGFSTEGLTTSVQNNVRLTGFTSVVASEIKETDPRLINAIATQNVIVDPSSPVIDGDIGIAIRNYNNIEGSITIDLTIKNEKAWTNGKKEITKTFKDIKLLGFTEMEATSFVSPTTEFDITGTPLADYFANESIPENELKAYIFAHKGDFFTNDIKGTSVDNIKDISILSDISHGTIKVKFRLNQFLGRDGKFYYGSDAYYNFIESPYYTFTGFNTKGITTKVAPSTRLDGYDGEVASDYYEKLNNNSDPALRLKLLTSILDKHIITDCTNKKEPTIGDINVVKVTDYNDIEGSITITLQISNGLYWENGRIISIRNVPNIKLTGFKTMKQTNFVTTTRIDISGTTFAGKQATNRITDEDLKTFIIKNIALFLDNPLDATSENNIVNFRSYRNPESGEISIDFYLNRFMNSDGHPIKGDNPSSTTLLPSPHFVLYGFDNTGLTTEIPEKIATGLSDIIPSNVKNSIDDQNRIITGIIDSGLITGVAYKEKLKPEDLRIKRIINYNDVLGEVELALTITNGKYWKNATVISSQDVRVTITGLHSTKPTEFATIHEVDASKVFAKQYASNNIDKNALADFIVDNVPLFLQNPVGELKTSNILNIVVDDATTDITKGRLGINFEINSYMADYGHLISPEDNLTLKSPTFILTGFKATGLTTEIVGGELDDVANILPSTVKNSYSSKDRIANAIIRKGYIRDTSFNKKISARDLSLDVVDFNDKEGNITLAITIQNNLSWENGKPIMAKTFPPLVFSHLNTVLPTTIKTGVAPIVDNELSNSIAIDYSINETQNYVFQHLEKFVDNPPASLKLSDVVILDFKQNLNLGQVTFKIALKQYINDTNGHLVVDANETSTPPWLVSTDTFVLSGFMYGDIFTTSVKTKEFNLEGVSNIYAENVSDYDESIKRSILKNIQRNIINLAYKIEPSALSTYDIDYEIVAGSSVNKDGTLKAHIFLKNKKGWIEGVTQPRLDLGEFTLKGFKTIGLTTTIDTSTITINAGPLKEIYANNFDNTHANDLKDIIINQKIIKNTTLGEALYKTDISFENITNIDPEKGSLTLNIAIINQKAWKDGVKENKHIFENINIVGFKKYEKPVMKIKEIDINSLRDSIWKNPDGSINKFFMVDWEQYKDNTPGDQLKAYIESHQQTFVANYDLNKDFAIGNVTYTLSPIDNTATFTVEYLNLYLTKDYTPVTREATYKLFLSQTPSINLRTFISKKEINEVITLYENDIPQMKETLANMIFEKLDIYLRDPSNQKFLPDTIVANLNEILNKDKTTAEIMDAISYNPIDNMLQINNISLSSGASTSSSIMANGFEQKVAINKTQISHVSDKIIYLLVAILLVVIISLITWKVIAKKQTKKYLEADDEKEA